MLPLAGMLFNVVAGLVVDIAQDLAEEHVGKMLDDILPEKEKIDLDENVFDFSDDDNDTNEVISTTSTAKTETKKEDFDFDFDDI